MPPHTPRVAGSSCGLHPTHLHTAQGDSARPRSPPGPMFLGCFFSEAFATCTPPPKICKHTHTCTREHTCFTHAHVLCMLSEHVVKRRHVDPSSDQSVCTSPGWDLTQPTNKKHSPEQPAGSSSGQQDGGGRGGEGGRQDRRQGACSPDRDQQIQAGRGSGQADAVHPRTEGCSCTLHGGWVNGQMIDGVMDG